MLYYKLYQLYRYGHLYWCRKLSTCQSNWLNLSYIAMGVYWVYIATGWIKIIVHISTFVEMFILGFVCLRSVSCAHCCPCLWDVYSWFCLSSFCVLCSMLPVSPRCLFLVLFVFVLCLVLNVARVSEMFVLGSVCLRSVSYTIIVNISIYTLRQKLSTTLYFYRYIFLHQYC
jgi:hypothetical protein